MAVECHARVARVSLDAGEHLAGELLPRVALAQLGALGVVELVQLERMGARVNSKMSYL